MKDKNKQHQELDELLNSIKHPEQVKAPEDILLKVHQKINKTPNVTSSNDFLKWAALWLILLMNIASYYTFIQTPNELTVLSDADTELQLLVEDYDFEDNLYEEPLN